MGPNQTATVGPSQVAKSSILLDWYRCLASLSVRADFVRVRRVTDMYRTRPHARASFPPRFAMASTCMHNALIARIPIRNARREIRKCPMKSSEDYLKSTTKSGPAAGRESDVAAQLNGHWPACYGCCRAADAVIPPAPEGGSTPGSVSRASCALCVGVRIPRLLTFMQTGLCFTQTWLFQFPT